MKKNLFVVKILFAMLIVCLVLPATPAFAGDENTFVTVQGSKLMVGNREFFGKGATYIGGRWIQLYEHDGNNLEAVNERQFLNSTDFNVAEMEKEIAFQKTQLGINLMRIFTPSYSAWQSDVTYQGWQPWFKADGSINPIYLSELQTILSIAKKYGIRVQVILLDGVTREVRGSGQSILGASGTYGPIDPGSTGVAKESFYKQYVQSLVPVLSNDPTLISYEIDTESLVDANINYNDIHGGNDFAGHMLSFQKRMIDLIRSLDHNHLIASGEVSGAVGSWLFPAAEYALIPDVDHLNNNQSFSLGSLVDYYAPHLYSNDPVQLNTYTQAFRAGTTKPIVLGETGYMADGCSYASESQIAGPQAANAQDTINAVVSAGLQGSMTYTPYPQVTLVDGQFTHVPVGASGYENECDYALDNITGRKMRGVFPSTWQYFSHADLSPLPAAGIFNAAYLNKMLNDSHEVSFNAPSQVTVGQTFSVSLTLRNTGTKTWNNSNPNPYQLLPVTANGIFDWAVLWGQGSGFNFSSAVLPGQSITINLNPTAPNTPGTYALSLQTSQSGIEFFGDVSTVQIQVNPTTTLPRSISLVSLQGKTDKTLSGTMQVYNTDGVTLIKSYPFSTNSTGASTLNFDIPLQSVILKIKATPYLIRSLTVDLNNNNFTFSALLTGDLNQDNFINSLDYSLLNGKWFTTDTTVDLNGDNFINSLDYSLMNKNWFVRGE